MKNNNASQMIESQKRLDNRFIRILFFILCLFVQSLYTMPKVTIVSATHDTLRISMTFDKPWKLSASNLSPIDREIFLLPSGHRITFLCRDESLMIREINKIIKKTTGPANMVVAEDISGGRQPRRVCFQWFRIV
ncbi:hypothetical protein JW979_02080 [bacterium]|nr:hypothetical protein [candidate division CSSED10-310 bacterium]